MQVGSKEDRQEGCQEGRQAYSQACLQEGIHTDRQTKRQECGQEVRQTDTQKRVHINLGLVDGND